MANTEWLVDLLTRVPVLNVDMEAARKAGDAPALSYAHAMAEWLSEATVAVHEAVVLARTCPDQGGASKVDGSRGSGPVGECSSELVSRSRSEEAA